MLLAVMVGAVSARNVAPRSPADYLGEHRVDSGLGDVIVTGATEFDAEPSEAVLAERSEVYEPPHLYRDQFDPRWAGEIVTPFEDDGFASPKLPEGYFDEPWPDEQAMAEIHAFEAKQRERRQFREKLFFVSMAALAAVGMMMTWAGTGFAIPFCHRPPPIPVRRH